MINGDRERPDQDEQVERTGRAGQPVPTDGLRAPGAAGEPPAGLDGDDAAPGGVDTAEFPGAGAP